jgi:hypothetical protein
MYLVDRKNAIIAEISGIDFPFPTDSRPLAKVALSVVASA